MYVEHIASAVVCYVFLPPRATGQKQRIAPAFAGFDPANVGYPLNMRRDPARLVREKSTCWVSREFRPIWHPVAGQGAADMPGSDGAEPRTSTIIGWVV